MAEKRKKVTVIENPNEQEILSASSYSFSGMVWSRFKRHKMAVFGFFTLLVMIVIAVIAPVFEIITQYPIKYAGGEKTHLPFSMPGVAVKIKDEANWLNNEIYPGGLRFWFDINSDEEEKLALETGMTAIRDTTFNSTYVDKATGELKAYRDLYIYNYKEYGKTHVLDREKVLARNDEGKIIKDEKGNPKSVNGKLIEFFVSRARLVRYNTSLNKQVNLYAPMFTELDTSNVKLEDEEGNVFYEGPKEEDIGAAPIHVLGTDASGHDMLVRLAYGARISLFVSLVAVFLESLIGIILGAMAGFYGGFVDAIIQRIIEILMAIPTLPILLLLSAFLGGSPWTIILIITFFGWTGTSRMIRGQFFSIRETEYVEAAKAIGSSDWRIMFRHMLPNAIAPIIVSMTIGIGGVIMQESSMSFLGLGINVIETPTWGGIINEAKAYFMTQPWPSIMTGLMIFLVTLSSNFMGDGLRDAIDPRLKI